MHDRISSFPEGWEQALLGDIVQILDHHRVPVNADERALRVGVYPYYGANGQAGTIDSFLFDGDFALLAEDGGNFDDSTKGVAYRVMGKFWVNNHAHILAPQGGMSTQFLVYALNALNWMPHVSGTTRLKLTQGSLKKVPLSIPPLPEQRRIVAKIEALQERSRKARAALEAIPPLLEQFRQSVLAAAFRGDLTADWRAQHPDVEPASVLLDRIRAERRRRWEEAELAKMQAKGKMPKDEKWKERYEEPIAEAKTKIDEIPKTWKWTSVDTIISAGPTNGYSPKSGPDANGTVSLKLSATTLGRLILNESTTKRLYEKIPPDAKYWLECGDILVQRANSLEYVGTTAIYDGPSHSFVYPDLMMRIRTDNSISTSYLPLFLNSLFARRFFQKNATGTAGNMPKINSTTLRCCPVPIPPLEEQAKIVEIVQDSLDTIEKLSAIATELNSQYQNLDQSILAKAFRGELVPQDPNDEPASVLLERIRTEREAQSAKPRIKKKTPGSTKRTKKAPPVSVNENDDLPLFNSLQK